MQPNSNRPVYIVQPTNITHLNVRPTIITTGNNQPVQAQQQQPPTYPISTIRQPTLAQPQLSHYSVQSQPRLVNSSPVYTSLQPRSFATTSPRPIIPTNTHLSPSIVTPQSTPRIAMVATQPTATTILRPALPTVSTSPKVTSVPATTTAPASSSTPAPASTSTQAAASSSKDFAVRVVK